MKNHLYYKVFSAILNVMLAFAALPVNPVRAADTGLNSPTACTSGTWGNPGNAVSSNNLYATSGGNNQTLICSFNLPSIPAGSTITGIEVIVEGLSSGSRESAVDLSWTGGINPPGPSDGYTTGDPSTTFGSTETTFTLGGASSDWGRDWSSTEFTAANFRVRFTSSGGTGTISLDHVQVRVTYFEDLTITASTGAGGTITPSGAVSVDYDDDQDFDIVPNTGFIVADVLVDTVSQGRINYYEFTNVTSNHTITATFDGGWSQPSANVNGGGGAAFSNPGNIYTSNNARASGGNSDNVTYSTFNIPAIPASAVIDGIEVALEGNDNGKTVTVQISGDGGSNYAPTSYVVNFTTTDSTIIVGGASELWSDTWTHDSFTNTNFRVRLSTGAGGNNVNIDQLQVKIHYTTIVTPTLSISNSPVTYTGSPQAANVTCSSGGAVSNVLYNGSSTVPTNANTYAVTANCAAVPGFSALTEASAGNFVINRANATINVTPYNVAYNGSPHTSTGTATGVLGEDLSAGFDLSNTTHTNAGTYSGDTWSFNGGTNYNNANGTVDNVINRANATIVVNPYNVTYDGSPHTSTGTATGVLGEDLSAGLNLSGTTHTNAGTYNGDTWSFNGGTNYNNANGTVDNVISPANATIVVNPYNVTYDGSSHTSTGTATGVLGEDLSAGLNLSGTTHTNAGTYNNDPWTFTDLSGNYVNTNGTVNNVINAASATITLSDLNHTYDGTAKSATVVTNPLGLSFSITYDGSPTAPTNADSYIVVATITDPNYSGTANDTLVIAPATVTPSITANNKVYDGNTTASFTCSLTGIIGTDDVTCNGTADFDNKNVGADKTVTATGIILGGTDATNYTLSTNSATDLADITARDLNVTATGINKVYDGNTNATVTLNDDRVGGDDLTLAYTSASFADPNVGNGILVSVSGISISSGADAGNYNLVNNSTTTNADITLASQTINVTTSAPANAVNGSTFDVVATATSGLPVTITTSGSCSGGDTDGNTTITMTSGTGTCNVFYNQAGNANYSAAPQVQENVTATDSPVFTSADNTTFDFGFSDTFLVTATGNPSTIVFSITGEPAGVTLTDNGNSTATLNYDGTTSPGVYTITFFGINGVLPNGTQTFTLTIRNGPAVSTLNSSPDTGNGSVSENENISTTLGITQITVEFNRDVYDPVDDTDPDDVTNPANYLLVRSATGTFATTSCSIGATAPDVTISVDSVIYDNGGGSGPFVATLNVNSGLPLNLAGFYRLFVCGTTSIVDAANPLLALAGNGVTPGTDFTRSFRITAPAVGGGGGGGGGNTAVSSSTALTGLLIPVTGFTPSQVTQLPAQPVDKEYAESKLTLKIPSLGVNLPIVGIGLDENGWDVTWLGNNAGYLEGSAYPTWQGNSILTSHVTDPNGKPGPFAYVNELRDGDKVYVHNNGFVYVYEVRESQLLLPTSVKTLFKSEEDSWLTLVTCENFNEKTNKFSHRRVIRAVLISIIPEK